jgi:hypothetical protein
MEIYYLYIPIIPKAPDPTMTLPIWQVDIQRMAVKLGVPKTKWKFPMKEE